MAGGRKSGKIWKLTKEHRDFPSGTICTNLLPSETFELCSFQRRSRRDSELEAQVAKLEKDLETSRQREDEITEHLREAEDHIDHLEGCIPS